MSMSGRGPADRLAVEYAFKEVAMLCSDYEKLIIDGTEAHMCHSDMKHFQNCMNFWFRNSPTRIEYLPSPLPVHLCALKTNMYKNVAFL